MMKLEYETPQAEMWSGWTPYTLDSSGMIDGGEGGIGGETPYE